MHFSMYFFIWSSNNLLKEILFSSSNQEEKWGWTQFSNLLNTTEPVSGRTGIPTQIHVHFSEHWIVSSPARTLDVYRCHKTCRVVELVAGERVVSAINRYAENTLAEIKMETFVVMSVSKGFLFELFLNMTLFINNYIYLCYVSLSLPF